MRDVVEKEGKVGGLESGKQTDKLRKESRRKEGVEKSIAPKRKNGAAAGSAINI